jgi:hypothetical protein
MVSDQGVAVFLVTVNDVSERFPDLVVPHTSPSYNGNPNGVYIEVDDDIRFAIVVDLCKHLDFKGFTHLRISYELDGSTGTSVHYLELKDFKREKPVGYPIKGRYTLSTVPRKVNGKWTECAFSFGALQKGNDHSLYQSMQWITANPRADEDLEMADEEVARKVRMLGKVVVTVARGNSRDHWTWLWDGHHRPDTQITSKEVVKTHNISHAVK